MNRVKIPINQWIDKSLKLLNRDIHGTSQNTILCSKESYKRLKCRKWFRSGAKFIHNADFLDKCSKFALPFAIELSYSTMSKCEMQCERFLRHLHTILKAELPREIKAFEIHVSNVHISLCELCASVLHARFTQPF